MSAPATLAELVTDVARREPEMSAIIFQGRPISYAQLEGAIEVTANALAARGIAHGDRVAIMLPNIPHFIVAYYATLRLGAVVVPINVLYKEEEIAYLLGDSEARLLITFDRFYEQCAKAARQSPSVEALIVVGAAPAPEGAALWDVTVPVLEPGAPRRTPATVTPDDLAVICYTSGTTGRSKGAMLTHRNFIANCEQQDRIERFRLLPSDRLLLVLPLFHIYGMNVGMNYSLRVGMTIVLVVRFEAIPVLDAIQQYRCTCFLGAPPMFVAWVNLPELGAYDLSSLRSVSSGAAALPAQVLARFKELTGVEINEGYGLTETSPVSHSNWAGPRGKPGTVGPPIPGVDARVVDEEDREVKPGAHGEIVLRGENVTQGYWRQPEATAEALRGGWFHTGDIGFVDEEGYYTIVDRKKDMINAGGFKVWPREVEEVLFRHPAVREVSVVAMPDPYAGERPMAYVALKEGQSATAAELMAYCKEHLASYKAPDRVAFWPELPKNLTGKVLRRALRDDAYRAASEDTEVPG